MIPKFVQMKFELKYNIYELDGYQRRINQDGSREHFCSKCGITLNAIGIHFWSKIHRRSFVEKLGQLGLLVQDLPNGKRRFKCEPCNREYCRISNLLIHYRESHAQLSSAICQECNRNFSNETNLIRHIRTAHDRELLTCDLCGVQMNRKRMEYHMRKHREVRYISCQFCRKRFQYKSEILRHMRLEHTFEEPFVCEHCPARFGDKISLNQHQRSTHYHLLQTQFLCQKCGAKMFSKNGLILHQKVCKGIPREELTNDTLELKCPMCAFKFVSETTLANHVERHDAKKERKFACFHCHATYFSKQQLRNHMVRGHTKDFAYICHCGIKFVTKHEYRSHSYAHQEEKAFQCEHCSFRTRHRSCLSVHLSEKHMAAKFQCSFCLEEGKERTFSLVSVLVTHLRRVHADKYDPRVNYRTLMGLI